MCGNFLQKLFSVLMSLIFTFLGIPLNEVVTNQTPEDEETPNIIAVNSIDEKQLTSSSVGDEYFSRFSLSNVTLDELYGILADMYNGSNNTESVSSKNYAYLLGSIKSEIADKSDNEQTCFTSPFRSVFDTLKASGWFMTIESTF